jgi:Domain of unknown function (DUF4352)
MGKAKKIGIAVGIIVAALVAITIAIGSLATPPNNIDKVLETNTTKPDTPNEKVLVGQLTFNLTAVNERPSLSVWRADGKYLIVTLTVENGGQQPVDAGSFEYVLVYKQSRFYSSSNAGAAFSDWLEEGKDLNPGLRRTGTLVFDVPLNAAAADFTLLIYGGENSNNPQASIPLKPT